MKGWRTSDGRLNGTGGAPLSDSSSLAALAEALFLGAIFVDEGVVVEERDESETSSRTDLSVQEGDRIRAAGRQCTAPTMIVGCIASSTIHVSWYILLR